MQESLGRVEPSRTNTYLLKDQNDIALFDHYLTSQVAAVTIDGRVTPLGKPGVHQQPDASPGGKYLLVRTTHKPYSYVVGQMGFPMRTEVWTLDGDVVRIVSERPLTESQPAGRDATPPGIRGVFWREDSPASLFLFHALDDGDPRKVAAKRDRLSVLRAPFSGEPQTISDMEMRFGGIELLTSTAALLFEESDQSRRARWWIIDPSLASGGTPLLVSDYNTEDRVAFPGQLVYQYDPVADRDIPLTTSDGRSMSRDRERRRTARTATAHTWIESRSQRANANASGSRSRHLTKEFSRSRTARRPD